MTESERRKERYYWLKEHGICVCCGSEKADKGYTTCLVCRMDIREKGDTHSDLHKEKHKRWLKRRRDIMYAFGVCVTCGKRDAEIGSSMCGICKAKAKERAAKNRINMAILPRSMTDGHACCAWCGSTDLVKGKKLCRKHYEIAKQNMLNARDHRKDSPNYFESSIKAHWKSRSAKGGENK